MYWHIKLWLCWHFSMSLFAQQWEREQQKKEIPTRSSHMLMFWQHYMAFPLCWKLIFVIKIFVRWDAATAYNRAVLFAVLSLFVYFKRARLPFAVFSNTVYAFKHFESTIQITIDHVLFLMLLSFSLVFCPNILMPVIYSTFFSLFIFRCACSHLDNS